MRIKELLYVLVPVLMLCLQSCNLDNVSRSQNGLVFCVNANVSLLDPQSSEVNVTSATIAKNVFNRLIAYNSEKNQFVSEIATSWHISENRKTYTFKLNPRVTFHTTKWFTPTRNLNADDVIFSFQRLMNYSRNQPRTVRHPARSDSDEELETEEQALIEDRGRRDSSLSQIGGVPP